MKSLITLAIAAALTGCGTTADWSAAAGAMAGELNRQAQTGTGVYTKPYANQPSAQQITPYRCVSKRNPSTGNVTTECR